MPVKQGGRQRKDDAGSRDEGHQRRGPLYGGRPRSAGASHIFLIARYRRMSGSDLTASTPNAFRRPSW
jgi:hypothetical protein